MISNAKLNDSSHKVLLAEAVHTCECVWNSMATTNSHKSPFGILWIKAQAKLVCFLSLDELHISLIGRKLWVKGMTIHSRQLRLDMQKIKLSICKRSITPLQRGSLLSKTSNGLNGRKTVWHKQWFFLNYGLNIYITRHLESHWRRQDSPVKTIKSTPCPRNLESFRHNEKPIDSSA